MYGGITRVNFMSDRLKIILLSIASFVTFIFITIISMGALEKETNVTHKEKILKHPFILVWNTTRDFSKFPEWNPSIVKIEVLQEGKGQSLLNSRWKEYYSPKDYILFEVTEDNPNKDYRVDIIESSFPMKGYWKFSFTKIDEQKTKLRIDSVCTINSYLLRFFYGYIVGYDYIIQMVFENLEKYLDTIAN